jgi:DNA-binding Lrp family transcriptional regulator
LELGFDVENETGPSYTGDTGDRILAALSEGDKPMSRADIVSRTGISPSAWNRRIKELVDEGKVVKLGWRRDSTYRLPS